MLLTSLLLAEVLVEAELPVEETDELVVASKLDVLLLVQLVLSATPFGYLYVFLSSHHAQQFLAELRDSRRKGREESATESASATAT